MRADDVAQDVRTPVLEPGAPLPGATTAGALAARQTFPSSAPDEGGLPAAGYRAGILGAGFMGGVHSRAVRTGGGRVVSVAAAAVDTARAAAHGKGAERACGPLLVGLDCHQCAAV